ncbi:MAG: hypothetical protein OXG13_22160 [Gemmatimonadaceae bacterium]|nr:hypothetical protein [Gemmatimonadaceae bacterium]
MNTPPPSYRRTQFGRVIAASCLPGLVPVVVLVWYIRTPEVNWVAAAIAGVLVLVLLLFGSLTVEVSGGHVRIRFGIGLIHKRWPLDGIEACRPVRNTWLYGWGIRKIPGGWLYNVSGLDAVELKLKGGKTVRIGTDEPQALAAALEKELSARTPEDPQA